MENAGVGVEKDLIEKYSLQDINIYNVFCVKFKKKVIF